MTHGVTFFTTITQFATNCVSVGKRVKCLRKEKTIEREREKERGRERRRERWGKVNPINKVTCNLVTIRITVRYNACVVCNTHLHIHIYTYTYTHTFIDICRENAINKLASYKLIKHTYII